MNNMDIIHECFIKIYEIFIERELIELVHSNLMIVRLVNPAKYWNTLN